MSTEGTIPLPGGRSRTFPRVKGKGKRLGILFILIEEIEAARKAYVQMEKVKAEAKSLTKELSEENCEQCMYTQGEVTLQNIQGWSNVSIAYQFYICKLPVDFQVMKIMEWTYGVSFDGFSPKECELKESKAHYDQFFDINGELKFFMAIKHVGMGLFLKQARSQNTCALKGMPPGKLKWYFMQHMSARYAREVFAEDVLDINVIYKPMPLSFVNEMFPESN